MKFLFIIPARGGSKGIPHKNIKLLAGKPLICYSIDVARAITKDEDICITTDDEEIINVVERYGLEVPFKRPNYLATDTATTNDVLLHAIDFYESLGKHYDTIVLLQPTSPRRTIMQVKEAISLYDGDIDMIVSVKESHAAAVLCEEDEEGYIKLCFNKKTKRRQDMQTFYEYNGSIYIINIKRLKELSMSGLSRIKKYVMPPEYSIDIDNKLDWSLVELFYS